MYENPELTHRGKTHLQYDQEIYENDREIKLLSTKIYRSDYQQKEIERLRERQKALLEKQREHQEYLRSQDQLEKMNAFRIDQEKEFKRNMNEDYRNELERKHANQQQNDRRQKQQEQAMLKHAQQQGEQEAAKLKYYQEMYRRRAISDVQYKEKIKELKKQELEEEKALFRKRYENSLGQVNPKSTSYKEFFDHFTEQQRKAEQSYKDKVLPRNIEKEASKEHLVNKGVYQVAAKSQQAYIDSVNRSVDAKRDLREYLKRQMDEKDLRRSQTKQENYEDGVRQLEALQQIAGQQRVRQLNVREDTKFPPNNEEKSLVAAYNLRRSSQPSLGSDRKIHNPITNPIDFKFGYTNPYIVREFEHAKRQAMGDGHLRLGNLALLGSSSLLK